VIGSNFRIHEAAAPQLTPRTSHHHARVLAHLLPLTLLVSLSIEVYKNGSNASACDDNTPVCLVVGLRRPCHCHWSPPIMQCTAPSVCLFSLLERKAELSQPPHIYWNLFHARTLTLTSQHLVQIFQRRTSRMQHS
jgi:hypothetical protein